MMGPPNALLQFIDRRIEACLSRPEMWGSLESVEAQVLQLLDVRSAALNPYDDPVELGRRQFEEYNRFLRDLFPGTGAKPLSAILVDERGPTAFTSVLREFANQVRHKLVQRRVFTRPVILVDTGVPQ